MQAIDTWKIDTHTLWIFQGLASGPHLCWHCTSGDKKGERGRERREWKLGGTMLWAIVLRCNLKAHKLDGVLVTYWIQLHLKFLFHLSFLSQQAWDGTCIHLHVYTLSVQRIVSKHRTLGCICLPVYQSANIKITQTVNIHMVHYDNINHCILKIKLWLKVHHFVHKWIWM